MAVPDATRLSFDGLKASLIDTLRANPRFTDYNFSGSGMNVLLDVLANAAYIQSMYYHMVAQESFIESAQIRRNVVSLAAALGYMPSSKKSAVAVVDIDFGTQRPSRTSVATGDVLSASVGGSGYSFEAAADVPIVAVAGGRWAAIGVPVVEGVRRSMGFVASGDPENDVFVIPDPDVDMGSLVVRVQANETNTEGFSDQWSMARTVRDLGAESRVFFASETDGERYAIRFGDGFVGRALQRGNRVTAQWVSTLGADANGVGASDSSARRVFKYAPWPTATVRVVDAAAGGSDRESMDSVRANAPLAFAGQDRAVTASDYQSIIARDYGSGTDSYVWGGEDNDPPKYGEVFVSIRPPNGRVLSDTEKRFISDQIFKSRNMIGVSPTIVDPDYIYVRVESEVTFDPMLTAFNSTELQTLVQDRIAEYVGSSLNSFNRSLRFSKLSKIIDDLSVAIVGNQTSLTMEKRFEPDPRSRAAYVVAFGNPIERSRGVTSTAFRYTNPATGMVVDASIADDGDGKLSVVSGGSVIAANIGTVDYESGRVAISRLQLASTPPGGVVAIRARPAGMDILSERNTIITLDQDDPSAVIVSCVPVSAARPGQSGTPFPFRTSNR